MKIYKNLWAGYDSYFVHTNSNSKYAYGITVHNGRGQWEVSKSMKYYVSDIKNDREHFPIVGEINLHKILIEAVLNNAIVKIARGDKK